MKLLKILDDWLTRTILQSVARAAARHKAHVRDRALYELEVEEAKRKLRPK